MTWGEWIGLWVAALLSLMIFSFLYRDNPFYKFAEHLFVGVSAAYWMVEAYWGTLIPNMFGKLAPKTVVSVLPAYADRTPDLWYIIPLLFGIFLLMRLIPPVAHFSRLAMAMAIGFAAGTNLTRYLQSDFVSQIGHTIAPLVSINAQGFSAADTIANIVIVGGVLSGLMYFFFSKEHSGFTGKVSRAGIYVLMVSFGAAFGYTVMARISLLTGRMEFLGRWLSEGFTLPG